MDWSKHFPDFIDTQKQASASPTPTSPPVLTKQVEIADIGCGFGGLLVALSPLFPNTLMLGLSYPDPYRNAEPLTHRK
jgi:tRNA (guanine-N7-)-methyltransferase